MAAKRRWSDLSERTRKLIIVIAVAESILKAAVLIDIKASASKPDPGPEVAVGSSGSSGQHGRDRADLVLHFRTTEA